VRPSVKMLPTDCVPYTNRINPSVKLFNGVVLIILMLIFFFHFYIIENCDSFHMRYVFNNQLRDIYICS
jgi:hypothetical protein